jgi:hypothetical protein
MNKFYSNYYEDFAINCWIPENKYILTTETSSDWNINNIDYDKKNRKWIYSDYDKLELSYSKSLQSLKYMMPENWHNKKGKFLENVAWQFNKYMAYTFYGINRKLAKYYNNEIKSVIETLILILKTKTNIQEIVELILSFVYIKNLKNKFIELRYL